MRILLVALACLGDSFYARRVRVESEPVQSSSHEKRQIALDTAQGSHSLAPEKPLSALFSELLLAMSLSAAFQVSALGPVSHNGQNAALSIPWLRHRAQAFLMQQTMESTEKPRATQKLEGFAAARMNEGDEFGDGWKLGVLPCGQKYLCRYPDGDEFHPEIKLLNEFRDVDLNHAHAEVAEGEAEWAQAEATSVVAGKLETELAENSENTAGKVPSTAHAAAAVAAAAAAEAEREAESAAEKLEAMLAEYRTTSVEHALPPVDAEVAEGEAAQVAEQLEAKMTDDGSSPAGDASLTADAEVVEDETERFAEKLEAKAAEDLARPAADALLITDAEVADVEAVRMAEQIEALIAEAREAVEDREKPAGDALLVTDAEVADGEAEQFAEKLEAKAAEDSARPAGDALLVTGAEVADGEAEQFAEKVEAKAAEDSARMAGIAVRNSSDALYAALDALEDMVSAVVGKDGDGNAYSAISMRKSQAFRDLEGLALEARSLAAGLRARLERMQDNVVDRLKLEADAAAQIADFAVRRAALDSSRLLLGTISGRLPPPSSSEMPFASLLDKVESEHVESSLIGPLVGRQEDFNGSAESAQAKKDAKELMLQAAAFRKEAVDEAVDFAKDALSWAGALAVVAASQVAKVAEALLTEAETNSNDVRMHWTQEDLYAVFSVISSTAERAGNVGLAAQQVAAGSLAMLQADFKSYLQLRERGQLPPTLLEEAGLLGFPALPALPAGQSDMLSTLKLSSSPSKQHERKEFDLAVKQLQLAMAVGNRGVQDSGDALVYGILPALSAIGKVTTRRLADVMPKALRTLPLVSSDVLTSSAGGGKVEFMHDLAQQLAIEFASSSTAAVRSGILPDLAQELHSKAKQVSEIAADTLHRATHGSTRMGDPTTTVGEHSRQMFERASDVLQGSRASNQDDSVVHGIPVSTDADDSEAAGRSFDPAGPQCDPTMDVECTVVDDEQREVLTEKLVKSLDLMVLCVEMMTDMFTQTLILEKATQYVLAGSGFESWKLLTSLRPDRKSVEERAENSRHELRQEFLNAITKFIERK